MEAIEACRRKLALGAAGSFFTELKRRNVYKVAVAYAIVAWLLIQVATQTFPFFEIPSWTVRLVILLLILGFPVALVLAWAFELTPQGIKRTEEVAPNELRARRTGRNVIAMVAVLAALGIGLFLFQLPRRMGQSAARQNAVERPSGASLQIPEKSIAVLPFENRSADKENAYFTDGVQDEILTDLAKIADLKVISRTSVMHYKSGVERNLREIGKQLGVAHLLEGSVQRANNRIG